MALGEIVNIFLTKHEIFGFGFSIIGGADPGMPPAIGHVLDGSPAGLCKQVRGGGGTELHSHCSNK